jgi:putative ABC transport system permease protein
MNINQYRENVKMALNTLRSHKLRSLLTVLGVIIGVLTVIVIASILTGLRSNIIGLIEQYGTHNIYAFHLSTGIQIGPHERSEWQRKPLEVEDADAIARAAPSVQQVSYFGFSNRSPTLKYGRETYRNVQLQGVPPQHAQVTNLALSEGRFFNRVDDRRRNQVAVLGTDVAEALFPRYHRVAGRTILVDGSRFTVIGILEKRKTTFLGSNDEDNAVYIPYRTMKKLSPRSKFLLIVARAHEGLLEKALDEVEVVLRRQRGLRFDQDSDFDLNTSDGFLQQFDSITSTIGLVAIAISGVGLLVGGIGVMNIMLVSVTERTREIGVRRAVGAKRRDIVFQFLFEASTLTTLGGILGILLAIVASYVIIFLIPEIPATIPIWAVVTGFLVSVSVGLIFGVWPAVKAAHLDPIEALHHE